MHKDLFSNHAGIYAAFRPAYPVELYDFIFQNVKYRDVAWDCATGNGQVASYLAEHFKDIYATDISAKQLDQAERKSNIQYGVGSAEQTTFPDRTLDLITVAQALHWFDRDSFYLEAKRTLKSDGILAVWGYGLLSVNPSIDEQLLHFYKNIIGPYWDSARKLVDESYQTISFPFEEIPSPPFFIKVSWTLGHLAGYLETWSATQKYIEVHKNNPVTPLIDALKKIWTEQESKIVSFPIFLRLGKM